MLKSQWIWILAAAMTLPISAAARQDVPAPAQPLPPAEVSALLARVRLSSDPQALDAITLQANEAWTPARNSETAASVPPTDWETDKVVYYHAVAIEIQQTHDNKPLTAGQRQKAQQVADQVKRAIDRAWRGPQDTGRLIVIEQQVWRVSQIQAEYVWTGVAGPDVDGHPTAWLTFSPLPGRAAHSRDERMLLSTRGYLQIATDTGQVLGGTFSNLHPVSFGGGLLARFDSYSGSFTMQPMDSCWVLHTIQARMRGRELLHFLNGVESVTYLDPQAAAPAASGAGRPR